MIILKIPYNLEIKQSLLIINLRFLAIKVTSPKRKTLLITVNSVLIKFIFYELKKQIKQFLLNYLKTSNIEAFVSEFSCTIFFSSKIMFPFVSTGFFSLDV